MSVLRPYQVHCVESVFREWEKVASTLIVLPTGTGKSLVFSEIVRRIHPKRSLIVAHRSELIDQAVKHVKNCGLQVQVEKADLHASTDLFNQSPVVVASVQTLISGAERKRMHRFPPEDFGLLVLDEAHRAVSPSFISVLKHFQKNPNLKVFGCTATSDRLDRKALGTVFQSVATSYEIVEAISDGWLVPLEQRLVRVGPLDLSQCRTTAGDLNGADLSAVLEQKKNVLEMCSAAIEIVGDRKSICFTASVRQAEMCTELFNDSRSGMAACVSGSTPEEERKAIISAFASRKHGEMDKPQVLVNCSICVEGFDVPDVECIIMNKPTKSRTVYCQAVGRATRPLAGILDDLHSAYERKMAIEESPKKAALILDFVGNSGKHKLMTTCDILGGSYSAEVRELAVKKAEKAKSAVKMQELLKESEEIVRQRMEAKKKAEEARKVKLVAKVQYSTKLVNPFDAFDVAPQRNLATDYSKPLSEKQRNLLLKIGVDPEQVDYRQAQQIIVKQMDKWKRGLATVKQCVTLRKFGYETKDMTFKEASEKLNGLAANNWKRPHLQPA